MRAKIRPDLMLPRFAQPPCDSPPHDPELSPDALVGVRVDACGKESCRLLRSPFVQGITEAGTQRVPRELKPDPLVIRRAAAALGSCKQRTPQFPQNGGTPLFSGPECLFQSTPQTFDVGRDRSSGSR